MPNYKIPYRKFHYSTKSGKKYLAGYHKKANNIWKGKNKGRLTFAQRMILPAVFSKWKAAFGKAKALRNVMKGKFKQRMPLRAVSNVYKYLGRPFGKVWFNKK